jgi:hypothetical protein
LEADSQLSDRYSNKYKNRLTGSNLQEYEPKQEKPSMLSHRKFCLLVRALSLQSLTFKRLIPLKRLSSMPVILLQKKKNSSAVSFFQTLVSDRASPGGIEKKQFRLLPKKQTKPKQLLIAA